MHVVDGEFQIDDGDEHLCKLRGMPKYEIMTSKADRADSMNPDRAATVTVSERSIGRYMRLFTFPKNVYRGRAASRTGGWAVENQCAEDARGT